MSLLELYLKHSMSQESLKKIGVIKDFEETNIIVVLTLMNGNEW